MNDDFSRTTSGQGWGEAPLGGTWTVGNPASAFVNTLGALTIPSASVGNSALLYDAGVADSDLRVRMSVDKAATGYGQYISLVARRNGGLEYRMRLRIGTSGDLNLSLSRSNGGTDTALTADTRINGVVAPAGTWIWLRSQAVGSPTTTLRMKAWLVGQPEPAAWTVTATDSTSGYQVPGGVGIRASLSGSATNSPVTVYADDFRIVDGAGRTSPTSDPTGFFVASDGSDSNAGTYSRPWRSLQHAADVASGTVNVRGGTYQGFTLKRSGLTFAAWNGEVPVVHGDPDIISLYKVNGATIRGFTVEGAPTSRGAGILVGSSSNVLIENNLLRNNRSYGVRTWYSTSVTIRNNEVTGNDVGIQISYTSDGVRVLGNRVHDNNHELVNTPSPSNDDNGAVGIAFLKTTGPVLAQGNLVWGNRAPSYDYGYDGGAFEVFGASDVTITGNTTWDNKDVLETGTTSGGACNNITFTRNVAYGASSVSGWARGLILACASNSLFAYNTFDGFDMSALSIVYRPDYSYQGSLNGLRVENNVFVSNGPSVYYLDSVPSGVTLDYNLAWNRSGGSLAYMVGTGSRSWSQLRSSTGFESHGINLDPQFVDSSGHDYHLRATSPAIGAGVLVGVDDASLGGAPDLGRFEAN